MLGRTAQHRLRNENMKTGACSLFANPLDAQTGNAVWDAGMSTWKRIHCLTRSRACEVKSESKCWVLRYGGPKLCATQVTRPSDLFIWLFITNITDEMSARYSARIWSPNKFCILPRNAKVKSIWNNHDRAGRVSPASPGCDTAMHIHQIDGRMPHSKNFQVLWKNKARKSPRSHFIDEHVWKTGIR